MVCDRRVVRPLPCAPPPLRVQRTQGARIPHEGTSPGDQDLAKAQAGRHPLVI